MSLELVITIFVAFSVLFLGSLVFFNDRKSVSNTLYYLISLVTILWSISNYFSLNIESDNTLFWIRMVLFFAAPHTVLFLFFILNFPDNNFKIKPKIFWSYLILLFFVMFLTLTNFVFSGITIKNNVVVPIAGSLIPVFALFIIGTVGAGILISIRKYKNAIKDDKIRWKFMLVGVSISYFLLILTNFFLVNALGNTFFVKLAPMLMLPTVFGMGYAILRHHLLNVKVVTTELVVFALLTVSLVEVTVSKGFGNILFKGGVFLLLTLFSILLVKSVHSEILQREQMQKLAGKVRQANLDLLVRNRYLSALQSLTNEITKSLDFKKVTQEIVDGIALKLGFAGGFLFLLDKDKKSLGVVSVANSRLMARAMKYLPKPLSEYKGNYLIDNDLTVLAMRTGRVQIGTDLHSFLGSSIPKGIVAIIQSLMRVRSILAVPISTKDSVVGCLVVVSRKNKNDILTSEIQMIQALSDEVGIITTNLELYDELESVNKKLVLANHELARLDKAKTEFLSIASHQLRTPLTAIKGYLSMIIEGDYGKLPSKMDVPIKDIYESSERLIILINDLLDVSRIASGKMEINLVSVDLIQMTKDVIEEIRPKAEIKNLNVFIDGSKAKDGKVLADSEKLRQVVINLIDNAIKYTEKGDIAVLIEAKDSVIKYSVIDNGIGISQEELTQLFTRFARTKEAKLIQTEGTGLGLYVAKSIIEVMNGRIWAESDGLGKGSRFIFELPMANSKAENQNNESNKITITNVVIN